jgi:hypothetical protein
MLGARHKSRKNVIEFFGATSHIKLSVLQKTKKPAWSAGFRGYATGSSDQRYLKAMDAVVDGRDFIIVRRAQIPAGVGQVSECEVVGRWFMF